MEEILYDTKDELSETNNKLENIEEVFEETSNTLNLVVKN
jgi:hypothetical protein